MTANIAINRDAALRSFQNASVRVERLMLDLDTGIDSMNKLLNVSAAAARVWVYLSDRAI